MTRAGFLYVSKKDCTFKSKKDHKERGSRDYKGLDDGFPWFTNKRKMGLAAVLEGQNGRLIGLRSQE